MAAPFFQVPDWTASENQGANVACADLNSNGTPELLVLRVDDSSNGPNVGFYRVGWALDPTGNVGNWGPWIEIRGWGSIENDGAALAVADFGVDGLALVVLQIEHRVPGPNRGLYCIGRGIDASGN